MAEISQITLPSGSVYDIKDAWARSQISAITGGDALVFKGASSTVLTDGGTENPTVGGNEITAKTVGDIYFYENKEYIWGPNPAHATDNTKPENMWHELGSTGGLKALAFKDSASTTYQPAGTINTISFTGSALTMSTSYTPVGNVTVSVTSTASAQYAVSSTATGATTYKPAGSVTSPTFTGTAANIAMSTSYTPAGTVSTVAIGVNEAGATTSINNPTPKTVTSAITVAAPGATAPAHNLTYYDVSSENLRLYQIGYSTIASIDTTSVTVKTGDASYKMNGNPTFTGTEATISASTGYTPAGSNSIPTFDGTAVRLVTSTISIPNTFSGSFSGAAATISVSGTPSGSVTQPVFTGTTTTITVS